MTQKKKPATKQVLALHVDRSIKNVWVDNIQIAGRTDDVCLVRLSTSLPEGLYEQTRFMTSKKLLRNFVDSICSTIDYYPVKPQVVNDTKKNSAKDVH